MSLGEIGLPPATAPAILTRPAIRELQGEMKFGKVDIPQEAFIAALKVDV